MIDPRFTNFGDGPFGPGPFVPGPDMQPMPMPYHHRRRRHHGRHKHKPRHDDIPLSRNESLHKVDYEQRHRFTPIVANDAPIINGVGVSRNDTNVEETNENKVLSDDEGSLVRGTPVQTIEHQQQHRRDRSDQSVEAMNLGGVPEQLIGQRSASALSNQGRSLHSPVSMSGSSVHAKNLGGGEVVHRRHHRHHHHHGGHGHMPGGLLPPFPGGGGGYGYIDRDLIFIERGSHSQHRQDPPRGFEYKGRIEVQCGGGQISPPLPPIRPPLPPPPPIYPPLPPPPICPPLPPPGPCPPGSQPMILSPTGGVCPQGGAMYTAQAAGFGGGVGGGFGGGGVGSFGGGSYGPSQGQIISDTFVGQNIGGGAVGSYGGGAVGGFGGGSYGSSQGQIISDTFVGQNIGGASSINQFTHSGQGVGCFGGTKVIEVWQKRHRHTRSPGPGPIVGPIVGPSFDFERFRSEILAAIERIVVNGGSNPTFITGGGGERVIEKVVTVPGETRVIVQPIQPVFYMPRQTTETPRPPIPDGRGPIGIPLPPQPVAPQVVYVPRNVYVPVIKPVFVPRERIIVRPQVIHVARPVLVDRPVPVTQRPIIIERERPIPVPIRPTPQANAGGSRVIREDYVYRDNLPVAYGGRCAEFAGGINYGYMPTQVEHQYGTSSTYDVKNVYPSDQGFINENITGQTQVCYPVSQANVGLNSSISNIAGRNNVAGLGLGGGAPLEVLDPCVNPNWQRTDQTGLASRYGRTAVDIVQRSQQVGQQTQCAGGVSRSFSGSITGVIC